MRSHLFTSGCVAIQILIHSYPIGWRSSGAAVPGTAFLLFENGYWICRWREGQTPALGPSKALVAKPQHPNQTLEACLPNRINDRVCRKIAIMKVPSERCRIWNRTHKQTLGQKLHITSSKLSEAGDRKSIIEMRTHKLQPN